MRFLLFIFTALSIAAPSYGQTIVVAFWNLENLFDCKADSTSAVSSSDREFTPSGSRHWTPSRFSIKCLNVAKTMLYIGDECKRLPDIIALAEVENEYVVRRIAGILNYDFGLDYGYIHHDSPDRRGIDVACLYRKGTFRLIDNQPIEISEFRTRDILHVILKANAPPGDFQGLDTLHFFVCHMPSKYGGATASSPRREKAVSVLMRHIPEGHAKVIVTGDFNTVPDDPCLVPIGEKLCNEGLKLSRSDSLPYPAGTHKFKGDWNLIDNFFSRVEGCKAEMEICRAPFLLEKDLEYGGDKPRRTYVGPRYNGGTSDHLPVYLKIKRRE